ncbi:hypothetical protein BK662_15715 [Pseudomonas frederiksbergensis]|uniref:Uncharacterized protein n=1 Tax=Pseudomonas frederiksbergensis TaxID=104087 RepID=A0A423HP27_9PSED|nr:hypothetical protein BK662_15715 [Pseudomonas frederiksbergensis]
MIERRGALTTAARHKLIAVVVGTGREISGTVVPLGSGFAKWQPSVRPCIEAFHRLVVATPYQCKAPIGLAA